RSRAVFYDAAAASELYTLSLHDALPIYTLFQGKPRKLLAQANRNGFFYVLDRTNGQMLMAKPFVKKLNWAKGILPDGRPDLVPRSEEHTSELQSRFDLVCRLQLEKKNTA